MPVHLISLFVGILVRGRQCVRAPLGHARHGAATLGVRDAARRIRRHRAVHVHRRLGWVVFAVQGRGTSERGRLWLWKIRRVTLLLLQTVVVYDQLRACNARLTRYRTVQQSCLLSEVTTWILQERRTCNR